MTYSEASTIVRAQFNAHRPKVSSFLNQVEWAKVRSFLYNVTVFVGVICYLTWLASRAAINAGKAAKALWVRYKIGNRVVAIAISLRSDVPSFLDTSRKQVEEMYGRFGYKVQQVVGSMASDYRSIREQIQPVAKG
ncbi:hypothetical protein [cf. Phormidesmis sp. LEGE 11477]|uniref:hypothetical protein n=1 Tax=cf. Phormidesmis sp. LEGE 11477 TaxID=1828680 RepID=UPI0018800CF2|nr:hypothetical protein [cf. Phormidesmis sp. LEGE 11477]MBE9062871.1 hypothetical protein [cf. Phormidesmis sp. LEGE 11477]